ncbi:MAG: neutral zinc metallopeptidase [Pirellulaceae bacterium]
MRWRGREGSQNIEDRRGSPGRRLALGGGGGLGVIVLVVLALLFNADPRQVAQIALEQQRNAADGGGPDEAASPEEEELRQFVSVVLRDTEKVWEELFRSAGREYEYPRLVLFRGRVDSACGMASAAVGPFYCPADERVYIDLSFYRELKNRFQAPGDFAQAYVIAHEVGHHVQHLLGISDRVHAQQQRLGEVAANDLSVRLELQADFFAGVWAHHAEKNWRVLESGDIEEALECAAAIGDDRLQSQSQGYVVPDSFTHGTSVQRARWFRRGLQTGDMNQGNTFDVEEL